eukprot:gene2445-3179_t
MGEADITLSFKGKKLFAAMELLEVSGLAEGSVVNWCCQDRRETVPDLPARDASLINDHFGGTADPCTDGDFWLGERTWDMGARDERQALVKESTSQH